MDVASPIRRRDGANQSADDGIASTGRGAYSLTPGRAALLAGIYHPRSAVLFCRDDAAATAPDMLLCAFGVILRHDAVVKSPAGAPPIITTVAEYAGQAAIRVSATQLGLAYSRADAKRIVTEWCRFFSRPSPILELHFTSRTPKRLFEALAGQSQLRHLRGGASSVRSLDPLARLRRLDRLHIESLRYVRDLSPLRHLTLVTDLEVGGDWRNPGSLTSPRSPFWPTCPSSAILSFIR